LLIASIAIRVGRRARNLAVESVSVNEIKELDEMNRFMEMVLAVMDYSKPYSNGSKQML
jgi:hypothetical protein